MNNKTKDMEMFGYGFPVYGLNIPIIKIWDSEEIELFENQIVALIVYSLIYSKYEWSLEHEKFIQNFLGFKFPDNSNEYTKRYVTLYLFLNHDLGALIDLETPPPKNEIKTKIGKNYVVIDANALVL